MKESSTIIFDLFADSFTCAEENKDTESESWNKFSHLRDVLQIYCFTVWCTAMIFDGQGHISEK